MLRAVTDRGREVLNQLLKFTLVSGFLLWLRRRWKWLAGCGGVIAAAMYLHGEYLDYVEALPPGSEETTIAGDYIAVAFAIKNVVIFASLLTYFLVEMRASKRRRRHRPRSVDVAGPLNRARPLDAALRRATTPRRTMTSTSFGMGGSWTATQKRSSRTSRRNSRTDQRRIGPCVLS